MNTKKSKIQLWSLVLPAIDMLFSKVHDKNVKEDNFDVEEELKLPCFSQVGDI